MYAIADLNNESDVEQKFVYPFLIDGRGLGYSGSEVATKSRIRKLTTDKGRPLKGGYFPDYIVSIDAVPVLIVEAKAPDVPLDEALREARLYGNELNAQFPAGVNPVQYAVAVNGREVWVAPLDSTDPKIFELNRLIIQSEELQEVRQLIGRDALLPVAFSFKRKIWPAKKFRPLDFMKSATSQKEEVEPNRFAKSLIPYIKKYFDPDASRTRLDIVEKAYVSTDQATQYSEILEALLADNLANKKFRKFNEVETTKNDARGFNQALRDALAKGVKTDSLLLLIGGVGSGKSIFIDRFFYLLMDDAVRQETKWAFVDFNDAPSDLSDLKQWICERVLADLEDRNQIADFHTYENLLRYFSPEISKFRSGSGASLYTLDRAEYERRLATKLDEWTSDPCVFLKNVLRHIVGDTAKRVVVVFDNADKRDRDQQLRIFQEVQNFRSNHRVFSILSLRDETYDRHRSEPPLDTYLAAFTFRISPPRFLDVVKRRLELIIEDLSREVEKHLEFHLPSGAVVRYPSTDLGTFLISFYQALFHPKREIRLVLEALAGRNVRRTLQMFSDILMSGHLTEDKVFIARVTEGSVHLPERLVLRILMRTKYQYYSDGHGYIWDIFRQAEGHEGGTPLGLILVLGHLAETRKQRGELGIEGYRLVSDLIAELSPQGLGSEQALAVLNHLLSRELIRADHQRVDAVGGEDFVKITASGYYHLKFLTSRFEYAVGTAGDLWFRLEERARRVYELTRRNPGYSNRSGTDRIRRVDLLLDELSDEYKVLRESSLIAISSSIDEALASVSGARERFKSGPVGQAKLRLY